jgi:hypothetical protein
MCMSIHVDVVSPNQSQFMEVNVTVATTNGI